MSSRFQNILLLNAAATGAGTALSGDDRETSVAIFTVTITGTAKITFQGSAAGGVTTYSILTYDICHRYSKWNLPL